MSAFGQSLPPLTGSFKGLLHLNKFLVEMEGGVGGGWWAHPPALAALGKMALGARVGFLGIGWSVSRRAVQLNILFGTIATPKERLWGRNPKPCCVHDSKHWEWIGLW